VSVSSAATKVARRCSGERSPIAECIEFFGVEVHDTGIVGRRGFQGDHIEAVAGTEEVMAAIGHDLVHLWVL
jgi:hypothetical protein